VANTLPRVSAFQKELKINTDKTVTVNGYAYHNTIPLSGVQFRIDDNGDWMAAAATDGMFDSLSEAFIVSTLPLKTGKHTINIKAIDAAGNSADTNVTADIP
jgi:hypothetical protein